MIQQKSIEQYFQEFKIIDPDYKAELLPELTKIIYDRNMHAVAMDKEEDEYKKQQLMDGLEELDQKIAEIFKDFLKDKESCKNPEAVKTI